MTDSNNQKQTRPSVEARPTADIYESEKDFRIVVDMPGVKRDDVSVSVDGGRLELRATRAMDDRDVTLVRAFKLPQDVDVDAIEAVAANGVLTLTLTKRRPPEPKRIAIKAA
jgi:HSP20 family molecular chaperone IbpA